MIGRDVCTIVIIVDPKLITLNHASAKGPCLLRYGALHGCKQKPF